MNRYITPMEAFRLSGYDDLDKFMTELNDLLGDGLPSVSRLHIKDSVMEDRPRATWANCRVTLFGDVVNMQPERWRDEYRDTERGVFRPAGSDTICYLITRPICAFC